MGPLLPSESLTQLYERNIERAASRSLGTDNIAQMHPGISYIANSTTGINCLVYKVT